MEVERSIRTVVENNLEVIQQAYDMGEKDAHIRMKALKDWMNLPEV